eukprot:8650021-Pyramimonas_sp.AAC.1
MGGHTLHPGPGSGAEAGKDYGRAPRHQRHLTFRQGDHSTAQHHTADATGAPRLPAQTQHTGRP